MRKLAKLLYFFALFYLILIQYPLMLSTNHLGRVFPLDRWPGDVVPPRADLEAFIWATGGMAVVSVIMLLFL